MLALGDVIVPEPKGAKRRENVENKGLFWL